MLVNTGPDCTFLHLFAVFSHPESSSSSDEEDGERRMIKVKAAKSHRGPYDFDLLVPVQNTESAHNVSYNPNRS